MTTCKTTVSDNEELVSSPNAEIQENNVTRGEYTNRIFAIVTTQDSDTLTGNTRLPSGTVEFNLQLYNNLFKCSVVTDDTTTATMTKCKDDIKGKGAAGL